MMIKKTQNDLKDENLNNTMNKMNKCKRKNTKNDKRYFFK